MSITSILLNAFGWMSFWMLCYLAVLLRLLLKLNSFVFAIYGRATVYDNLVNHKPLIPVPPHGLVARDLPRTETENGIKLAGA